MATSKKSVFKIIPHERIIRSIYIFRGQKVMVDRDLAELYGIETENLMDEKAKKKTWEERERIGFKK